MQSLLPITRQENLKSHLRPDIMMVSETHIEKKNQMLDIIKKDQLINDLYTIITDHKKDKEPYIRSKGTALIINKHIMKYSQEIFRYPGRVKGVLLKRQQETCLILCIYLQTNNTINRVEFRQVKQYIQNILNKQERTSHIIIGGQLQPQTWQNYIAKNGKVSPVMTNILYLDKNHDIVETKIEADKDTYERLLRIKALWAFERIPIKMYVKTENISHTDLANKEEQPRKRHNN